MKKPSPDPYPSCDACKAAYRGVGPHIGSEVYCPAAPYLMVRESLRGRIIHSRVVVDHVPEPGDTVLVMQSWPMSPYTSVALCAIGTVVKGGCGRGVHRSYNVRVDTALHDGVREGQVYATPIGKIAPHEARAYDAAFRGYEGAPMPLFE